MDTKTKGIIRKIIYLILIGFCIYGFIYIGNKYTNNGEDKVPTIEDYYENTKYKHYEVVGGTELINLLRKGNNVIYIGNSSNKWSIKYIEEIDKIFKNYDIDKVYYYDIVNDKSQKNSNYYKIISLLEGYLVSNDSGDNNLLSPSLYIINDGEVLYYNIDTVMVKNNTEVSDYWTSDKESLFETELSHALLNYYLNN
jgi:hypothetical protein